MLAMETMLKKKKKACLTARVYTMEVLMAALISKLPFLTSAYIQYGR